jgi:hypothetical protein
LRNQLDLIFYCSITSLRRYQNPFTKNPETRNAFLQEFNIGGDLVEFPYNSEDEIFNVEEIIEALKK